MEIRDFTNREAIKNPIIFTYEFKYFGEDKDSLGRWKLRGVREEQWVIVTTKMWRMRREYEEQDRGGNKMI